MTFDSFFSGLMRERGNGKQPVTTIELFFDLVFVFAVTQLSHLLLEHLSWHGVFQTALLLLAMWTCWIYTAWVTNWLDPQRRPVRLMLILLMLIGLMMSAALPEAFGDRGLAFAALFVLSQLGRTLFFLRAVREDPPLVRNFQRIIIWMAISGIFWLAGGIADGSTRELLWVIALTIDYLGPAMGFVVPGLGRSTTHDWASISGGHMAERCQLFLIIALGESILVTGATFAQMDVTFWVLVAFITAFAGSAALWWIYFDRSAEDAGEEIAHSDDPGRLARSAYTYLHLPMVAGIIVTAVGDEMSIAHPTGDTGIATALLVCGGPALFLAGHAMFKYAVWQRISIPRVLAIASLLVLVPIGTQGPPVMIAILSTVVVVGVVLWDASLLPVTIGQPFHPKLEGAEAEFTPFDEG